MIWYNHKDNGRRKYTSIFVYKKTMNKKHDENSEFTPLDSEEINESTEIQDDNESMEETNEMQIKIDETEFRIQELEILIEQAENRVIQNEEDEESKSQYYKYIDEYNELLKKRKKLIKESRKSDNSALEQVSTWVIIFGLFLVITSFPLIAYNIWMDFANWLIAIVDTSFSDISEIKALYYVIVFLIIFALPLIINLITWLIYNNFVKTKTDKKFYIGFWILEGLMSIGLIIYMSNLLFGAM